MQDVRNSSSVKRVQSKIEKMVLERIWHTLRIGNGRLHKSVVFGLYEKLKRTEMVRERRERRCCMEEDC